MEFEWLGLQERRRCDYRRFAELQIRACSAKSSSLNSFILSESKILESVFFTSVEPPLILLPADRVQELMCRLELPFCGPEGRLQYPTYPEQVLSRNTEQEPEDKNEY